MPWLTRVHEFTAQALTTQSVTYSQPTSTLAYDVAAEALLVRKAHRVHSNKVPLKLTVKLALFPPATMFPPSLTLNLACFSMAYR